MERSIEVDLKRQPLESAAARLRAVLADGLPDRALLDGLIATLVAILAEWARDPSGPPVVPVWVRQEAGAVELRMRFGTRTEWWHLSAG